jgi:hypothetical protein
MINCDFSFTRSKTLYISGSISFKQIRSRLTNQPWTSSNEIILNMYIWRHRLYIIYKDFRPNCVILAFFMHIVSFCKFKHTKCLESAMHNWFLDHLMMLFHVNRLYKKHPSLCPCIIKQEWKAVLWNMGTAQTFSKCALCSSSWLTGLDGDLLLTQIYYCKATHTTNHNVQIQKLSP